MASCLVLARSSRPRHDDDPPLSNDTCLGPRKSAHTDSRLDMDTFLQILNLDEEDNHGFKNGMTWS
ncbi:hypothetical protein JB92DRAFT_940429 [Gautieria morchelliformis]|nr:hypothetical protein JB92DRAFT_940429 [Gautieria morchelliformis]